MPKCCERFCRKTAKRYRSKNGRIHYLRRCSMHEQQRYVRNHPERAAFHSVRKCAKKRGHEFTITYEQFLEVITGTDYIKKKGLRAGDLTIDRIWQNKGYIPGNLRVVTRGFNTKKMHFDYAYYACGQHSGHSPEHYFYDDVEAGVMPIAAEPTHYPF